MCRIFGGILFIALLPAITQADEGVPWANKFFQPKDPPPIVVHDFGTVPYGTTLTHRFELTNLYAVQMQIMQDPTVSCGCTRVLKYTQKLEAREKGFVDVEMDARKFQGSKAVTIQVRFGPKFQSTAILQVRAFARTDVQINPGQINFGTVAQGQKPAQAIDVTYTGQQINWQITGVEAENNAKVKATYQRVQGGRSAFRINVELKDDAEPGMIQEQILLKTNDAANPVISLPVTGAVQGRLAVVQGGQVRLDTVKVGEESVRNITVRGNKPFKIVKIEGDGQGLTVKYTPIPDTPIQTVNVVFAPTQAGELKRKLTFTTDQNESTSVTIEGVAEAP